MIKLDLIRPSFVFFILELNCQGQTKLIFKYHSRTQFHYNKLKLFNYKKIMISLNSVKRIFSLSLFLCVCCYFQLSVHIWYSWGTYGSTYFLIRWANWHNIYELSFSKLTSVCLCILFICYVLKSSYNFSYYVFKDFSQLIGFFINSNLVFIDSLCKSTRNHLKESSLYRTCSSNTELSSCVVTW